MILFNPKLDSPKHFDEKTKSLMQATIEHFENKGLRSIKADWHAKAWNYEFVHFLKQQQGFATLMTPAGYGDSDSRWDTFRNTAFAEIAAFYGTTYWYTFQVSVLGILPIWMGSNEKVKQKTVKLLQDGAVFAFGLSEKEHGADIMSSEMMLHPQDDGTYLARGRKYYIGNGNEAGFVSTFGKIAGTDEYVFFVVESQHPNYQCVKNTVNEQNYVAEYALYDYPITDDDILERGDKAWDNMLNTINVGKFNLGFCSIGLCTHAFYEAIDHASDRVLYNHPVTQFPHVRRLFNDAYCRLVAMKLFAHRAIDYMRSANSDDRRYLLFNPLVKMKVTTQGEEVKNLLWEIIAAKGFEAEPFFEITAHEVGMLRKLEGTAHVNMALVVKFMNAYMFNPAEKPEIKTRNDAANDDFLFEQGPTHGLGHVTFDDYHATYDQFESPNLRIFKELIQSFRTFLEEAGPTKDQQHDIDYMLAVGELFCLIPYGQLILEGRQNWPTVDDDLMEEIWDVLIRDFARYATELHGKPSNTDTQRQHILSLIKAPASNAERFDRVWENQIQALRGQYRMRDQV